MKKFTERQKAANNFKYYKDRITEFTVNVSNEFFVDTALSASEYKKNKVNFDLFNNKIDPSELSYVCNPYKDLGPMPAKMTNKDIVSGKIKVYLGMESKKPFFFNSIAVNPEATTRKEQKESAMLREFVIDKITQPIREQATIEAEEQFKGKQLTQEELSQIKQSIEAEVQSKSPKEVKKYMMREHQDPAEMLNQHIANYLIQSLELKDKFELGLKYSALSAKEIYYIGILNKQLACWNVNTQNFRCQLSDKSPFIEDSHMASCDYYMSITDIIEFFGDEISGAEINQLYKENAEITEHESFFSEEPIETRKGLIKVTHFVWKDLRDIQILHYFDEEGEIKKKFVTSDYVFNEDIGDIHVEKIWVPEVYETWRIGNDLYKYMRPVSNQIKDLDNPNTTKLPYYGAVIDNLNSEPTSLMDRLVHYQYYFNIIMYRIDLLMASDKGKKILANINMVPDDNKISLEKWNYILETTPFIYYNLDQEGSQYSDVNSSFKQLDLSLASDISKYVELAAFTKKQAGESIGIPEQVEGQIGPDEAVNNVKQSMVQNLHILEPYYKLHNSVKKNVLQACVDIAKILWQKTKPEKLAYILDDGTKAFFDLDLEILNNNTVGIFISDTTKAEEIKDTVRKLTHAAMQNQRAELSDVISVLRDESLTSIQETLKVSEQERREEEQQAQERQAEQQKELLKIQEDMAAKAHERAKELIIIKEEERRKTEIQKTAVLGASFNPEQDGDGDKKNDFIEIARGGLQQGMEADKLNFEKQKHKDEMDIKKAKLLIDKAKVDNTNKNR